jgi:hypothetical protein
MNIRISVLTVIFIAMISQDKVLADKIYLKSGKILEGKLMDANKMDWVDANDIIIWSEKSSPIVPRSDILRVEKEFKKPEGLALLAKDDNWGKPENGYVTQMIAQSDEYAVGKPMKFGLVLKNVSDSLKWYDHQAIKQNTLTIKSEYNNEPYYKVGPFQTAGGPHPIDKGEIITLFENLNITDEYVITKSGKYTIQFRGGNCGIGIDSNFPPSNIIEFEVKPGTPDERDLLISSLIKSFPAIRWHTATSHMNRRDTPSGRKNAEGISVWFLQSLPNTKGGVIVTLWQTKTPAEVNEQGTDSPVSDYLGKNTSGYFYITIPTEANVYWPKMKEDIIKALNIEIQDKRP